jgi:hypothetical protein
LLEISNTKSIVVCYLVWLKKQHILLFGVWFNVFVYLEVFLNTVYCI